MSQHEEPYARQHLAMLPAGALGVLSAGCTVTESNGTVRDATFSESVKQFFDNLSAVADTAGAAADLVCAADADCSSGSISAAGTACPGSDAGRSSGPATGRQAPGQSQRA